MIGSQLCCICCAQAELYYFFFVHNEASTELGFDCILGDLVPMTLGNFVAACINCTQQQKAPVQQDLGQREHRS